MLGKLIGGRGTEELEEVLVEAVVKTVDAFFIHEAEPEIGSVVYCNLLFMAQHSGIYVGRGKIIHLNGQGFVEKVSPKQFVQRFEGLNPAFTIFCATDFRGKVIGSKEAAKRAKRLLNSYNGYNIIFDNCHKFTTYCLTGEEKITLAVSDLEETLKKDGFHRWRASSLGH